ADVRQRERGGDRPRIGVQYAVHISPDLDGRRVERRAEDGGGVVRAVAAQRRRAAVFGGADESGHDGHGRPSTRPAATLSVWRSRVAAETREVRADGAVRLRKI